MTMNVLLLLVVGVGGCAVVATAVSLVTVGVCALNKRQATTKEG
jgi:hypothetical protein